MNFNPPTPCGVGPPLRGRPRLQRHFNPPTPCGVGLAEGDEIPFTKIFQSTHPVWGGTKRSASVKSVTRNFNPPTPCGVGQKSCKEGDMLSDISIHPPRVGWDIKGNREKVNIAKFQSTHPVWGGTLAVFVLVYFIVISIHPPRVGWDGGNLRRIRFLNEFQSTHPVWGGTPGSSGQIRPSDFNPPTPCGVGQQKFTKQAVELLRK